MALKYYPETHSQVYFYLPWCRCWCCPIRAVIFCSVSHWSCCCWDVGWGWDVWPTWDVWLTVGVFSAFKNFVRILDLRKRQHTTWKRLIIIKSNNTFTTLNCVSFFRLRELLQPDSRLVDGEEISHELSKVNPFICFKVKGQFMTVKLILCANNFHW